MNFVALLEQYGYLVLFFGLMLELIALPIPGEILMSYSGFLVFQGDLNWATSILIADLGSSLGITLAYFIGYKLGAPFFRKHGHRIHLTPERLDNTSKWFDKYGNKMLIIGYFIPGVRHITGYFSGMIRTPFHMFAIFAYIGSFLWTSAFITLGKILGPRWELFHGAVKKYLIIGGILAAFVIILVYIYKTKKEKIDSWFVSLLNNLLDTFHTLGRVRLLVGISSAAFLGFFILMLGMIEDFLSHEFAQFDLIASFIVNGTFTPDWIPVMRFVSGLTGVYVLIPLIIATLIWVLLKGKNKGLEIAFLLWVALAGEGVEEGLRRLFHRMGPTGLPYSFPSEQSLVAITVFGFAAFLVIRHVKANWPRQTIPWFVLFLAIMVGLSRIYLGIQYPSDVGAGYVFGGVWLTLNIILLEIFRHLNALKTKN